MDLTNLSYALMELDDMMPDKYQEYRPRNSFGDFGEPLARDNHEYELGE